MLLFWKAWGIVLCRIVYISGYLIAKDKHVWWHKHSNVNNRQSMHELLSVVFSVHLQLTRTRGWVTSVIYTRNSTFLFMHAFQAQTCSYRMAVNCILCWHRDTHSIILIMHHTTLQ